MERIRAKNFVYNLVYDVCEYFLQTVFQIVSGYMTPRAKYFSKFGRDALFKFLEKGSRTFYEEIQNNKNFHRLNKVTYLEHSQRIITASNWKDRLHSEFFELCGKLAILGTFSDFADSLDSVMLQELTKLALEGEALGILHAQYDEIRREATALVSVVFNWQNMKLADFVIVEELDLTGSKFIVGLLAYLEKCGRSILSDMESNSDLAQMDVFKFKNALSDLPLMRSVKDKQEIYVYIAVLAIYCAKINYSEGIELAIDELYRRLLDDSKMIKALRLIRLLHSGLNKRP